MAKNEPTPTYVLGWLGRQIGHVRRALHYKPEQVVHRAARVEEMPVRGQPGVKLRRTVLDEVVAPGAEVPPVDPGSVKR